MKVMIAKSGGSLLVMGLIALLWPRVLAKAENDVTSGAQRKVHSFRLLSSRSVDKMESELGRRSLRHHDDDDNILGDLGGTLSSFAEVQMDEEDGAFYVIGWVGFPEAQRVSLLVDTTTHLTAFPCTGCRNCGNTQGKHFDAYFDPGKSETFSAPHSCGDCKFGATCSKGKPKQCALKQEGAADEDDESTWMGYQAEDLFYCGSSKELAVKEFTFACQSYQSGAYLDRKPGGVLGLGPYRDGAANYIQRLQENHQIDYELFSLCFRSFILERLTPGSHGVFTLGGVDERLHQSAMVYAKSKNTRGGTYYEVQVKHVFLQRNYDVDELREGANEAGDAVDFLKIHDSGTPMVVNSAARYTYLPDSMRDEFGRLFENLVEATFTPGKVMSLDPTQLAHLPTILLQLHSRDEEPDPSFDYNVPGYAGDMLDSNSPHDVLIVIPAFHYMEYESSGKFIPRIYFTRDQSKVTLGTNALQGYDVAFDVTNHRIGFARSNCDFDSIHEGEDQWDPASADANEDSPDESETAVDCKLDPNHVLEKTCEETANIARCGSNENQRLSAEEHWIQVVEDAGSVNGKECEKVMEETGDYFGGTKFWCDEDGLCRAFQPCTTTCAKAKDFQSPEREDQKDEDFVPCGPPVFWSTCDYSCMQSRVRTSLDASGVCVASKEEKRPCHVDACSRYEPCIVPFVVHAIIGFRGANVTAFDEHYAEKFVGAIAKTVNIDQKTGDEFFGPGDVKLMQVVEWDDTQEEGFQLEGEGSQSWHPKVQGMKFTVEIYIYNPFAESPTTDMEDAPEEAKEDEAAEEILEEISSGDEGDRRRVLAVHRETLTAMDRLRSQKPRMARVQCSEDDILPLGRTAFNVHRELERKSFLADLVDTLEKEEDGGAFDKGGKLTAVDSPFAKLYLSNKHVHQSEVISAWTIKTEVSPTVDQASPLNNLPLLLSFTFLVCFSGLCFGYWCGRPRDSRGRYKQVGATEREDDDEGEVGMGEDGLEMPKTEYRDKSYDDTADIPENPFRISEEDESPPAFAQSPPSPDVGDVKDDAEDEKKESIENGALTEEQTNETGPSEYPPTAAET